ncbi:nucleotidyltransferase [Polaribacter reichenbachii]|uniref:Nucleotidyltransferase n=1 Tax=Polaribacter reichenbachii TaxID=996801 RepID=A0A1B8TW78_9FLAO|nr:nucleotidyltransferase domain-containing protein [Polaribacter reichenbachii]APZ48057.1 nucleotidyltransferase [Polaribacter reichenbachii]AUC20531.1 nucleotidyltransferase [Polaribacter reichenbachii]OBY63991.1 nucleotidyltransferase [Polaribacter reichenbachii]
MTIQELKKSGSIIFECISGSKAYGLATLNSDTDIRGVFILPKETFYSLDYVGQINDEKNDVAFYELRKFIELCAKNNPNILEMLNVPDECILYKHPLFDEIKKEIFLSKLCKNTFANYAFTQIKKARGFNKKITNPVDKKRKSVDDFCVVNVRKKSISLNQFLSENSLNKEYCGLAKITHIKDFYNLFYNEKLNYKGVSKENANEVCLSSIPKEEEPIALLYFNLDGYSSYCKKYKEYWSWVEKRNNERYKSNISHNKNYDAKNMMHTFRLLHMAKEIGEESLIKVKRNDRDFLLSIKNAEFEYEDLVEKAERIKNDLDIIYEDSKLQEVPNLVDVNKLLISIRSEFYNQ